MAAETAIGLIHRAAGLFDLQKQRVGAVAPLEQHQKHSHADAPDADDLARGVDEREAVEQVPAVIRQRGSVGLEHLIGEGGLVRVEPNPQRWVFNDPEVAVDPLGQLMAEAHIYGNNTCSTTECFDTNIAPVAAQVPVVFGETGETYDASSCGSTNISRIMDWADAHGVGYEAWTWNIWATCNALISDFDGTPANDYGAWVRAHYLTFP
jgi:hypothetical protein